MLIIGVVAIAVAIVLTVYLLASKATAASAGATEIALPARTGVLPVPRSGVDPAQPLPPMYKRLGAIAAKFTPSGHEHRLQRRLDLAGNPRGWAAERVLAFKGIGLFAGLLLGAALGLKHGIGVVFFPLVLGAAGFWLPDVWIRNLGEHRQQELRLGLPDAIDMMTVCVEAGLGFDAAVSRVALNLDGPIAEEFARVLQEMQFGKSRSDAMRALVDRTEVPELRTFVSSVIQSSELGISVGDVLREQAREMRVRRRQRAEEKAQKLPVRILFPLLFCMLPAMFIVVIGPASMNILKLLGRMTH